MPLLVVGVYFLVVSTLFENRWAHGQGLGGGCVRVLLIVVGV